MLLKRLFDVVVAFVGLAVLSPVLAPVAVLVWLQDFQSPFYVANRVGKGGRLFQMFKLRSMIVNADKSGVSSTSGNDKRITPVGHFIRRFKLDELTQLINVLIGDMSLVGPRPNVKFGGTDSYTALESRLLLVDPGITDFASIVFSDEGDILKGSEDPDVAYNQLIRPGKSSLGLFYIDNRSHAVDLKLCFYTVLAIVSRERALKGVVGLLQKLGASPELLLIASRRAPLMPMPPPGGNQIIQSRDGRDVLTS